MAKVRTTKRARALKRAIDRWRDGAYTVAVSIRCDIDEEFEARAGNVTYAMRLNPEGSHCVKYSEVRHAYEIPEHLRRHVGRRETA